MKLVNRFKTKPMRNWNPVNCSQSARVRVTDEVRVTHKDISNRIEEKEVLYDRIERVSSKTETPLIFW